MRSLTLSAVAPVLACLYASALVVRLRCVFPATLTKPSSQTTKLPSSQTAKQPSQ